MITGVGLTVTTTSTGVPLQVPAEGVMRYVTVPDVMPFVEVSVCAISAPLPALAPVTFVTDNTVHEKFVPATPLGLVIATADVEPEQMVCALAATSGSGLTVTLTAYGVPLQAAAAG